MVPRSFLFRDRLLHIPVVSVFWRGIGALIDPELDHRRTGGKTGYFKKLNTTGECHGNNPMGDLEDNAVGIAAILWNLNLRYVRTRSYL